MGTVHNGGSTDNVSGKITIPHAASGLIIGRAGVTIRQLSKESCARIQLAHKEESSFTLERIVAVSGTLEACTKVFELNALDAPH
jgi:ribosomal protein S3